MWAMDVDCVAGHVRGLGRGHV